MMQIQRGIYLVFSVPQSISLSFTCLKGADPIEFYFSVLSEGD